MESLIAKVHPEQDPVEEFGVKVVSVIAVPTVPEIVALEGLMYGTPVGAETVMVIVPFHNLVVSVEHSPRT